MNFHDIWNLECCSSTVYYQATIVTAIAKQQVALSIL